MKNAKCDKQPAGLKIPKGTAYIRHQYDGPFMCSVDLAFNDERGDWDVILRTYPLMSTTCETITAFFHTLKEAEACVERNKKMWTTMGIPFLDENSEFHSSGNKFYEEVYRSGFGL